MAKVYKGIKELTEKPTKSVVTIGNFDGVHLAHQKLMHCTVRRASELGATSVVYTFFPHPAHILAPGMGPALINSIEDRILFIQEQGIDLIIVEEFTEGFASKGFKDYFEGMLIEKLSACSIFIGHDFTFGKGRLGTIDDLRKLGKSKGVEVNAIDAVTVKGILVSSTQIRSLIRTGKMAMAKTLMGRPFKISGKVVSGVGVGQKIGFPTANLELPDLVIPGRGVYPCWIKWKDNTYRGAVNIGIGPTFEKAEIKGTIEVHILDFTGDLYGQDVEIQFDRDRIRHEIKFTSVEDLKKQILQDIKTIEAFDTVEKTL